MGERPVPEQVRDDARHHDQIGDAPPRLPRGVRDVRPVGRAQERAQSEREIENRSGDDRPGDGGKCAQPSHHLAPFGRVDRPGDDGDEQEQIPAQRFAGCARSSLEQDVDRSTQRERGSQRGPPAGKFAEQCLREQQDEERCQRIQERGVRRAGELQPIEEEDLVDGHRDSGKEEQFLPLASRGKPLARRPRPAEQDQEQQRGPCEAEQPERERWDLHQRALGEQIGPRRNQRVRHQRAVEQHGGRAGAGVHRRNRSA